jgi:hypothetical protein
MAVAFVYRKRLFTTELEAELATMQAEKHPQPIAEGAVS